MFFGVIILGVVLIFFVLWGDYIKTLIFLEVLRILFITVVIWGLKMDIFSLNYFFACLIFLVCESRIGFLLFIFYISMEREVVKKMSVIQF